MSKAPTAPPLSASVANHHVVDWQRALGLVATGHFDQETLDASLVVLERSRTPEALAADEERPTIPTGLRPPDDHAKP